MYHPRIAVAGAGSLGVPVIKALTEASFSVTILTRSHTPAKLDVGTATGVSYATVDYKSVESLTRALHGHFGVISTLNGASTGEQGPLIQAAIAAGVTRFIPTEFGADMMNAYTQALPVFSGKATIEDQLEQAVKSNPGFSYTLVFNGAFLDWGLKYSFLLDTKNRAGTIFDSGDQTFSVTTTTTVARATVAVFQNLDQTKNRPVYIHDTVTSQNRLLEIAKKVDPERKEWDMKNASSEETRRNAVAVVERNPSGEEVGAAMVQLIYPSIIGQGYGGDFSGRTNNSLLGLKEMDENEIEQVVARYF